MFDYCLNIVLIDLMLFKEDNSYPQKAPCFVFKHNGDRKNNFGKLRIFF